MIKKKVLLFGATGMAGHIAYYYLQSTERYELINVVYRTKLVKDSITPEIKARANARVSEIIGTDNL